MKKALLVGSSFSAAPLFFALKKYDLHVTVCGGNPQDPVHDYADSSIFINYSDHRNLLEHVKNGSFDYIIPSCNDISYNAASFVAESLGLPGFDSFSRTMSLHNKHQFHKCLHDLNIPTPKKYNNIDYTTVDWSTLRYPLMIKPVDGFTGRGCSKINTPSEALLALQKATETSFLKQVVLEEFIEGSLHSHSAFIRNQNIACDFFADEFCMTYPFGVDCSHHPSQLTDAIKHNVRKDLLRLVQHFNLTDGLLHTQFLVHDNQFWILETMRRHPGDLYGKLIEDSTGFNYSAAYVDPFIEHTTKFPSPKISPRFMGRHTIWRNQQQPIQGYKHTLPGKNAEFIPLKLSGQLLKNAPFDKFGIIFVEFETKDEMLQHSRQMTRHITLTSFHE